MVLVIAVDPGRSKCGVAVVKHSGQRCFEILHRSVVPTGQISAALAELASEFPPDAILVGSGTARGPVLDAARQLQAGPVELVDEKFSSLAARRRFFRDNPPRGLRRLIPITLQSPDRPYDDYVAVILAERFLSR